ncbi:MAG: hypothetical protein ACYCPP_09205 [Nitrososphaerales archaeon]
MAISKQKQTYPRPKPQRDEEAVNKAIDETLKRHRSLYKKLAKM